jgi:hypothetical protein
MPVEASKLVGENGTSHWRVIRKNHLERISFDLAGDWTQDRQAGAAIVLSW